MRLDGISKKRQVRLRTGRTITIVEGDRRRRYSHLRKPWERYPQYGKVGSFLIVMFRNIAMIE